MCFGIRIGRDDGVCVRRGEGEGIGGWDVRC